MVLDRIRPPLAPTVYPADRPRAGIDGVLEDSPPNTCTRVLLIRRRQLLRARQSPPRLLASFGRRGLGARVNALDSAPPPVELEPDRDTAALSDAAERYHWRTQRCPA